MEDIIARFGCHGRIVTNNDASFKSKPLIHFCEQFGITLIHSTPYYPQGNRLAESLNKIIIKIVKILLEDNKRHGIRNSNFLYGLTE
jgi:transposase InsO family protein